ncbi:MAG TPA: sensor histidine kinase [Longimicrobiales bacterium]
MTATPDARTDGGAAAGRARPGHGRPRRLGPIVPPAAPAGPARRLAARVLRVPLFYKILLANAALIAAVAILGPMLAVRILTNWPALASTEVLVIIAGVGVALSVLVNAAILRVALSPLWALERTAARVQSGELDARAALSPVADRDLERLVVTFNGMLDTGASYRRRLREIAAHALGAAEEERKRIARELHDGIAQTLAALRIRLRLARDARTDADREALLEEVSEAIGTATEEVRRIARGLRPPALDMLGLAAAIESHARTLAEATGIVIESDLAPVGGLLTPEAELALYRVFQEALSNVVRHADASRVELRLRPRAGFVEAVIRDDGRGFAVDEAMAEDGRGLGLFGMKERASYVGGRVDIESRPGAGTRVCAVIPTLEAP